MPESIPCGACTQNIPECNASARMHNAPKAIARARRLLSAPRKPVDRDRAGRAAVGRGQPRNSESLAQSPCRVSLAPVRSPHITAFAILDYVLAEAVHDWTRGDVPVGDEANGVRDDVTTRSYRVMIENKHRSRQLWNLKSTFPLRWPELRVRLENEVFWWHTKATESIDLRGIEIAAYACARNPRDARRLFGAMVQRMAALSIRAG